MICDSCQGKRSTDFFMRCDYCRGNGFCVLEDCQTCNAKGCRWIRCRSCLGSGIGRNNQLCNPCDASGIMRKPCVQCKGSGLHLSDCSQCNGTGQFNRGKRCKKCSGRGKIQKQHEKVDPEVVRIYQQEHIQRCHIHCFCKKTGSL